MAAIITMMPAMAQLQAGFTADEAATTYYQQGWDTAEEFATWTYKNNLNGGKTTWGLAEKPQFSGVSAPKPFSSIDPQSLYSLSITYSNNEKDETALSPEIVIRDNSTVEYYLCLYAIWYVYADLKFYITDVATGEETQLISTFIWANTHAYTGPNWEKFSFDLSDFAGKTCRFSFRYAGTGGENVFIDGFRVRQQAIDETATVNIFEGEQVHFLDQSEGNPSLWNWEFEGGTPATSVSKNPVITYSKAGVYSVKLTVRRSDNSSSTSRDGYIHVSAKAPVAHIGVPDEGYRSPYAYCFVPTGVPVAYHDLSTGNPTSWSWAFEGGTPTTSSEQHPMVVYDKEGTFGVSLSVGNDAGNSDDFLSSAAIQAGGTQEVWNIEPEETTSDNFGAMSMGFFGYYAGTNWLGMESFAEYFHAPLTAAEVESVSVYFYSTGTVTPDAPVTVSLYSVGTDGMPDQELASATLRADELAYDESYVVPTEFRFDKPVTIEEPFFAVIGGIPHATAADGTTDDISIFCIRRKEGGLSTAYHYLAEWDDNDQPTGNYSWFKSDEPVSMAITPHLHYLPAASAITTTPTAVSADTDTLLYNIQGQRVGQGYRGIVISRGKKIRR